MKTLIFIHGLNGVGKSTICARLFRRLPHSSRLDSDWCRMINPFDLTPEIEVLAERHIAVLYTELFDLPGFLGRTRSSGYPPQPDSRLRGIHGATD